MIDYKIENWLEPIAGENLAYAAYWNDEEVEKSKEWYILDGNFGKMENYLQETGLARDLSLCVRTLKKKYKRVLTGIGIDLAAGNLWAAPYLIRMGDIDKLYCVEYSRHRLLKIGPVVLNHYQVPREKIILTYGNFYDICLDDNSVDFAFLSSAFHHADDPDRLLSEIVRVLKPGGIVILIGEHVVNFPVAYVKYMIKFVMYRLLPARLYRRIVRSGKTPVKWMPKSVDLFPADPILGDHNYAVKEYRRFFACFGFLMERVKDRKSQFQSFVLIKN